MADFNKAFALTLNFEGGLANDPDDKGGLTYAGVTTRDWPNWKGWPIIHTAIAQYKNTDVVNRALKANGTLQTLVKEFYKTYYWDVHKLDLCTNQLIASELFDTSVNQGTRTAALYLQQSLNVLNNQGKAYPDIAEDGIIGPQTIALVNTHPRPKDLLLMLNILQGYKYFINARNNPTQEKFMRSWLSRVELA
ncbi:MULTISPECIES: glycosyl hydrolase 108 family protein [unclassified Spirosoma]|uniref:glycoside hydrolase family 108 protein n=1 Tax=unclassified Spirosoma TaxID=2621999 RepID=UPI0009664B1A|nr:MULTISPECIES: glycosyl hydrolase 108 family protein [unclassified Spirosoma]MBN8826459.1 hypothetical protein [Spirosoma sp.]OJW76448.1 MAG: hypothetical protein BGO59_23325 [Spirosoma sp. 48-14]